MIHYSHSSANIYQIFSGSSKSWQALSFSHGNSGYSVSAPQPGTDLCQETKLWEVTPTLEGYVNHWMTVHVSYQSHRHFINLSLYLSFLTGLMTPQFYNTTLLWLSLGSFHDECLCCRNSIFLIFEYTKWYRIRTQVSQPYWESPFIPELNGMEAAE